MPENATYATLYNGAPSTSAAAIYTATQTTGIKHCLAVNGTGSAATITLTAVRKGGTTTDAYATTIATTFSVPANSATELLDSESLSSEYGELLLQTGDNIYGLQGTSAAITLILLGH